MIEEDIDIGPSSLMITYSERELGIGADRLAVVLRRKLLIGDQRSEFGEDRICLVQLAAPHMQPGLEQPKVRMMVCWWIQFQGPLDHDRCPCPLPEREQRFGGVPRKHGAEGALQAKLTGHFHTAQCLACRVLIPTDVIERVGIVDVEAQQRTCTGASGLTYPLECGEPLVLLTRGSQTGAQGDPGVRRDRVGAG